MFAYDKTFDPKVVLRQYDLISWFSDFPLYLGTQLVYGHTSFMICMSMTKPMTVKYSWVTVTQFHGSVILPYISTLSFSYFFMIMNAYDQTFNPNILIGHYDLISWFSDFALYLNTEWVYDHISFTLSLDL